jgi:uncharacterized protein YqgV (UPF0045/DUF77 family)
MADQLETTLGQAEQKPATPAATVAPVGKAEQTPAAAIAPIAKTFSEQELEQRIASVKGGYEGTIKKMQEDVKAAQKAMKEVTAQRQEQELAEFLRQADANGIPKDSAARFVDAQRKLVAGMQDYEARRANLDAAEARVAEGMKRITAQELTEKYAFSAEERAELLKTETPEAMREKSLELALAKASAGVKTTPKIDEHKDKGASIDLSKMSDAQALGFLWTSESKKK